MTLLKFQAAARESVEQAWERSREGEMLGLCCCPQSEASTWCQWWISDTREWAQQLPTYVYPPHPDTWLSGDAWYFVPRWIFRSAKAINVRKWARIRLLSWEKKHFASDLYPHMCYWWRKLSISCPILLPFSFFLWWWFVVCHIESCAWPTLLLPTWSSSWCCQILDSEGKVLNVLLSSFYLCSRMSFVMVAASHSLGWKSFFGLKEMF